jgi:hypothetical protein
MGRLNDEAGSSPALSRNCNPLPAESQVDPLTTRFHTPRGKEVEARLDKLSEGLFPPCPSDRDFLLNQKDVSGAKKCASIH